MTKFLHIVEQNLPDSDYQDQLDLLMKFKEDTLALYKSGKLDFFIAPIQNTGSIEIISRDGMKVRLNHRTPQRRSLAPSEDAEDPAMKNVPTTSGLAADLVKKDKRVQLSLEPVIRKVSDALNTYARS